TDETLERFIRSRTGSRIKDANNESLTRVAVSFYRARTVDLKSRLSATIASGLELSLDYPPAVSVSAWQGSEWNNVE
ncbi:hypothetical protein, partial [Alkalibacillus haloalkaliphilus]|uniref:hypothetical protein n=1 Tax=Alkalibacillus haloalkaliphilus TaxID=94136 RepID=UPI002936B6EE